MFLPFAIFPRFYTLLLQYFPISILSLCNIFPLHNFPFDILLFIYMDNLQFGLLMLQPKRTGEGKLTGLYFCNHCCQNIVLLPEDFSISKADLFFRDCYLFLVVWEGST